MSSLAYSVALSSPRNQKNITSPSSSSSSKSIQNQSRPQITPKNGLPSLQVSMENDPKMMGRREALMLLGGTITGNTILTYFEDSVAEASEDGSSDQFTVSPNGLAFCDKLVGFGPPPSQGQLIKAHYVGKLEDGKVFDSSYNRGKPLTFRVGVGEVIRGWDQGILGTEGVPPMLTGGKRRLRIPPELGYGVRGAGCKGGTCVIPPNSVLLFDVEFVGKA